MEKDNLFRGLAERWPSAFVARQEIHKFTGGIISDRYLANLDAAGQGIEGRIRVGRKVAYPVQAVIAWLNSRAERIRDRGKS